MRSPMSLAAGWLVRFGVLYALWLALIDNVHRADLLTGVACAALAAALATATRGRAAGGIRPPAPALARVPRTLVSLVTETVRVTLALLRTLAGRPVAGRFRAVRHGATGDDPAAAGRRALTEAAGSLGPNRYVLGIDPERGALIVHELVPSRAPLDPLGPSS